MGRNSNEEREKLLLDTAEIHQSKHINKEQKLFRARLWFKSVSWEPVCSDYIMTFISLSLFHHRTAVIFTVNVICAFRYTATKFDSPVLRVSEPSRVWCMSFTACKREDGWAFTRAISPYAVPVITNRFRRHSHLHLVLISGGTLMWCGHRLLFCRLCKMNSR